MIVFETRLTVPKGRLTSKEVGVLGDQLTRDAGRRAAEMVVERFREWLEPKGKFNIGASGMASANFDIVPNSLPGSGRFVWQVAEGNRTEANEYIRKGIPPRKQVTVARLRMWAGQKGITLVHPKDLERGVMGPHRRISRVKVIKGYQRRTGGVQSHGRTVQGSRNTTNAALSAIRNALLRDGTERPTANWWDRYPQNTGRFDYPTLLSRQLSFHNKVRNAIGNTAEEILLTFFSSGKRLGFRSEIGKSA